MSTPINLTLAGRQHAELRPLLYPGDGHEAVVIGLCGLHPGESRDRMLLRKVVPLTDDAYSIRRSDRVTWSTSQLVPLLEEADGEGLHLLKIHSHPGGTPRFSSYDDTADRELFTSVHGWLDGPHGSAIMLPNGRLFGRAIDQDGEFQPFQSVNVIGDDLLFWPETVGATDTQGTAERFIQAFGQGTYRTLRSLKCGVVGCSGTGSLVVEQLARNGVGKLVLVDPDHVEPRNLNRIVNATSEDARLGRLKVEVMDRSVKAMGFGTAVSIFDENLWNSSVVHALADCDVVFGCMDSIDGRHLLNRLATFYLQAYFDLGVKLEADGHGSVDQVCGTVHYLQPGGSSLYSRGVYTMEEVQSASLFRIDPDAFAEERRAGYIVGVAEGQPAVISVNMIPAGLAINEFLARLHVFRVAENGDSAVHRLSFSHSLHVCEPDGEPCSLLARHVGRGDVEPLLELPSLDDSGEAAAA